MITYKIPKYHIEIGDHPMFDGIDKIVTKYNAIINVSDDVPYPNEPYPDTAIHWFPICEFGYWTYQPFYWIVRIMDRYVENHAKIYVHCHAGAHRSPMMVYLYLRSLGNTPDEAYDLFDDKFSLDGQRHNWLEEVLTNDIEYGRIPSDVVEFMKDVRKDSDASMMSVMNRRKVMDLPPKTIEKNGVKKPCSEAQLKEAEQGYFHRD